MPGVFATWQPAYADAGIATFPVDAANKKPSVGNYLRAGRPASAAFARKFQTTDALGFACGSRSGLTVLDVDAPDENLLADCLNRYGPTPMVARTASGKFHAWYRNNGERRKIKVPGFSGPVDILGGGMAIAPPSKSAGGAYTFLDGASLADVASLPVMRAQGFTGPSEAPDPTQSAYEGKRNQTLFTACCRAAPGVSDHAALLRFAEALNNGGDWLPLPAEEVLKVVGSAWKLQCEGRNGFGGQLFIQIPIATADVLQADPDASYLYGLLRRNHWGRDFAIANDWRLSLPCGPWSRPRFTAARRFLLSSGLVQEVSPARRGQSAALYRFCSM